MAELARYPLIIPGRPQAVRTHVEAECARHGMTLDIALEIDAIPSVLDLVARGIGHAILSRTAIHTWGMSGVVRARRIVGPGIVSRLVIATSAQRPLTGLARSTIALIRSEIAGGVFAVPRGRRGAGERKVQ